MTITFSSLDIAWAAGFIDGEGCFSISRNAPYQTRLSPRYNPGLYVGNTNLKSLKKLQQIFGGSLYLNKKTGKIIRKTMHTLVLRKKNLIPAVRTLLPHLVVKKEQARLLLDFCLLLDETSGKGKYGHNKQGTLPDEVNAQRDAYYQAIRRANTK